MLLSLVILAAIVAVSAQALRRHISLRHIPAAGHGGIFSSYITSLRFTINAESVLYDGYKKYKGRIFKVAQMDRWIAFASGDALLENLRTAPEHVLSMEAAMVDLLQSDYTLGEEIRRDAYHVGVIRHILSKNLAVILPEILDEMVSATDDLIRTNLSKDIWVPIRATETFSKIVCRATNRAFIGLPLCRDEEYCSVNLQFTNHVVFGTVFTGMFLSFLKPVAGQIWSKVYGLQERLLRTIRPIISERRHHIQEYGPSYPDKPNDMLSWLMDAATPGHCQTDESLAVRMLNVNFLALHTTSSTFVHALYHLASKPTYINILREELIDNLGPNRLRSANDWVSDKLEKCWKLDSFFKESQRLNGMGAMSLPRKVMVPFTFSDGTVLPPGIIVAAAPTATHRDESLYNNAAEFDGLRFSKTRENLVMQGKSDKIEEERLRLTSTHNYLSFGGGRHACPGRFFASTILKSMMAHVILNYDVKLESGQRPADEWYGPMCMPSRKAKVLFKALE
ncbi:hypothetical protein PLEOSDRAFT_161982 [Pleurotus ostreatus PC15]|uniref:Cytochrome P450 n=1 Tax=Pleurotus ostreatus (strain PC15) TaxID=1137138 RepID=A0A067NKA8_PLEO1|nr:hypothetical protein PLEOSDRAFT_161982 [Pleurotus ostreatus PC15]